MHDVDAPSSPARIATAVAKTVEPSYAGRRYVPQPAEARLLERGAPTIDDFTASLAAVPVQLKALDSALQFFRDKVDARGDTDAMQSTARRGLEGAAQPLPHLDTIQRSFGRHDVSNVSAYAGSAADEAARGLGAKAYATEGSVVLGTAGRDLHTVAHEAAHVVQQRGGVSLKGGVGQRGDRYEQHADAVADKVVRGESAEGLLDQMAPLGGAPQTARLQLDADEGAEANAADTDTTTDTNTDTDTDADADAAAPDAAQADYQPSADLYPYENGGTLHLKGFAPDGTALASAHRRGIEELLDELEPRLLDASKVEFAFEGFASTDGSEAHNREVSVERADAAAQGLEAAWSARELATNMSVVEYTAFGGGEVDMDNPEHARSAVIEYVAPTQAVGGAEMDEDGEIDARELPQVCIDTFPEDIEFLAAAGPVLLRTGTSGSSPPAALGNHYDDLLFELWHVASGNPTREYNAYDENKIPAQERLDRAIAANAQIQSGPIQMMTSCVAGLEETIEDLYGRHYDRCIQSLGARAADELAEGTVEALEQVASGEEQDEAVTLNAALLATASVLRKGMVLAARFPGGDMNTAINEALAKSDANARDFGMERSAQGATHLLGVVNGLLAVYAITDEQKRREAGEAAGGHAAAMVRDATHAAAILGGIVSLTTCFSAGVAQGAGMADEAAQLFGVGAKVVRHVGQCVAILQIVHGIIVLADPDATNADKWAAIQQIGIGAVGLPPLMKLVGLESGPATFAIMITALELEILLGKYVEIIVSFAASEVREALNGIIRAATPIGEVAQKLSVALNMVAVEMGNSNESAAALKAGFEEVIARYRRIIASKLRRFVEELYGEDSRARYIPPLMAYFAELDGKMGNVGTPEGALEAVQSLMEGVKSAVDNAESLVIYCAENRITNRTPVPAR